MIMYLQIKGRYIMKLQDIPLNKLISSGNTKLPSTTAIFKTTSAHDCPSIKKGLCAACKFGVKCYAIKAEYAYHPGVLPYILLL
jgi:hypothetical protein